MDCWQIGDQGFADYTFFITSYQTPSTWRYIPLTQLVPFEAPYQIQSSTRFLLSEDLSEDNSLICRYIDIFLFISISTFFNTICLLSSSTLLYLSSSDWAYNCINFWPLYPSKEPNPFIPLSPSLASSSAFQQLIIPGYDSTVNGSSLSHMYMFAVMLNYTLEGRTTVVLAEEELASSE